MPSGNIKELREAIKASADKLDLDPKKEISEEEASSDDELEAEAGEEQAVEEDDEGIEYLNDLPQALGWTPEDLYGLKLRLSENQDPVPLGEIKDRLQGIEHERRELARQREQLEKQAQEMQQRMLQVGQGQQAMTTEMAQADAEIKAIEGAYPELEKDWASREKDNPGQVANERVRIGQRYEAAKQKLLQAQQQAQQQYQYAKQQWLVQQNELLMQSIPELRNQDSGPALRQEIAAYAMKAYGATPQDLENIDARTAKMLYDNMRASKVQADTEKAITKVKKAPKVIPKGIKLSRRKISDAHVAEVIDRALDTGKSQDKLAAAREILRNQ